MTEIAWNLKVDLKAWNTLTREQKIEALSCISESIDMFGDFEGMCEV